MNQEPQIDMSEWVGAINEATSQFVKNVEIAQPDPSQGMEVDPSKPPAALRGLQKFVPKRPTISLEEHRRSQAATPSPVDRLGDLEAKFQSILNLLEGKAASVAIPQPPPSAVPATLPTAPSSPWSETPAPPPPPKKGRGRPPGTGKHQIAARKAREALVSQEQVFQQQEASTAATMKKFVEQLRPSVSVPPSTQPVSTSAAVPATVPFPALSPGQLENLQKAVMNYIQTKDNWKIFRSALARTGTWKFDRFPKWMIDDVYQRLIQTLNNPAIVRTYLLGVLSIETTTSAEKAYFWIVMVAGFTAWTNSVGASYGN